MSTIGNILDGWKNYFQGSNPETLEKAKERASICLKCYDDNGDPIMKHGKHAAILPDMKIGEIEGYYCGKCKCPLSTAVRSSGYHCPLKKW